MDRTKESRAAQNRRAQQLFRRRREEHMKKLESDSAALGPALEALASAEQKLREMALVSILTRRQDPGRRLIAEP